MIKGSIKEPVDIIADVFQEQGGFDRGGALERAGIVEKRLFRSLEIMASPQTEAVIHINYGKLTWGWAQKATEQSDAPEPRITAARPGNP